MSEHKVAAPSKATVVSVAAPRFSKKLLLTLIAGIVVLGLGGYFGYTQWHKAHQPKTASLPKGVKQLTDDQYEQTSNGAMLAGDTAGGVKLAQQQNNGSLQSQLRLAAAYVNDKQYDKALEMFDTLNKQGKLNSQMIGSAGQIAEVANQNDRALKYYVQAADKARQEKGTATQQSDIKRYNANAQRLREAGAK